MSNWSQEEVEASVEAYVELFNKQKAGYSVVKKHVYEEMSSRYGRSPKSYEYRFQNISFVLHSMGLPWVKGLVPAANVGTAVKDIIKRSIERSGHIQHDAISEEVIEPTSDPALLETRVIMLRKRGIPKVPEGSTTPARTVGETIRFVRDPQVVAWVLEVANGSCESCKSSAPFLKEDATPYLEVHHIKWLSQGGSDTVSNAVALCPNCHRRLHYAPDAKQLAAELLRSVPRLKME